MEGNLTISFKFYNAQSLEFSNFTSRNLSHRYSSHVLKNAGVKVCIAKLCVKERKRKKKENFKTASVFINPPGEAL